MIKLKSVKAEDYNGAMGVGVWLPGEFIGKIVRVIIKEKTEELK